MNVGNQNKQYGFRSTVRVIIKNQQKSLNALDNTAVLL